jgi:hypothetical protein
MTSGSVHLGHRPFLDLGGPCSLPPGGLRGQKDAPVSSSSLGDGLTGGDGQGGEETLAAPRHLLGESAPAQGPHDGIMHGPLGRARRAKAGARISELVKAEKGQSWQACGREESLAGAGCLSGLPHLPCAAMRISICV